jgi:glutamate-5-semialdehyde dehydrogenase
VLFRSGTAVALIRASLDRLGVCNRLNWLLVDRSVSESFLPLALDALRALGVAASMPPHDHPMSHEWALDSERDATVTVVPVEGVEEALAFAHERTSGLAAAIVAAHQDAAHQFLDGYRGTGAFWNATTRWLDGFRLTGAAETGINVDHVPGPRGPVTYRDLHLRQYVVTSSSETG